MKKKNRFERICPICGKENLKYLSQHLSSVHKLSSLERKPYLAIAKYQGITVYRDEVTYPKSKWITYTEIAKTVPWTKL